LYFQEDRPIPNPGPGGKYDVVAHFESDYSYIHVRRNMEKLVEVIRNCTIFFIWFHVVNNVKSMSSAGLVQDLELSLVAHSYGHVSQVSLE
jgi:hypothetical protein